MDVPTARHLAELLGDDPVETDATPFTAHPPPGYRILHPIGEGASGRVDLAVRDHDDRQIALKIMKRALGGGKNAQRAWRELDLLKTIRSTRVPALIDYGVHKGRLYIATEFIDGVPIDRYAGAVRPGTRALVELLAKVCDAAGELHNHGVIHRDLKPSNILVTADGEPVIIDLGIAALLSSDVMQTLTEEGAPIGTPAYMAPEQARGERDRVGVRADVWSLGAVCCRVLTGRTPHDLADVTLYEAVHRVGSQAAREPRELDPTLAKPLAAVLAKACAMETRARYASTTELAADLRRWLNREPVEAQTPGAWVRTTRWMAKHPVLATAGVCGAMITVTVAGIAGGTYYGAFEPVGIEMNDSRTAAWTVARNGRRIGTIHEGDSNRPIVVSRAAHHDGAGWLIVALAPEAGSIRREVTVRDPDSPERVLWTCPDPGPFPPLRYPSYDSSEQRAGHRYAGTRLIVTDVFTQRSGDEIITLFVGYPDFPSALRVHGTDGEELYKVWIPGQNKIHWLEHRGLIVCAGANNRVFTPARTEANFESDQQTARHPETITFIKPELGGRQDRWLTHDIADSPTNAEGCWILVQPSSHEDGYAQRDHRAPRFFIELLQAPRTRDHTKHMRVELGGLLAEGELVSRGGLVINDQFEVAQDLEFSDGLEVNPAFIELRSLWGTPRFRFEPSPPFDPNLR